jgi:hypothetical protein
MPEAPELEQKTQIKVKLGIPRFDAKGRLIPQRRTSMVIRSNQHAST